MAQNNLSGIGTPESRFSSFLSARNYVRHWASRPSHYDSSGKLDMGSQWIFDLVEASPGIYCVTKFNQSISKALDYDTAIASAEWMEFPCGRKE